MILVTLAHMEGWTDARTDVHDVIAIKPNFLASMTTEIFVFLRSTVINLSMRIRFRVIYKNYVIFFFICLLACLLLLTPGFYGTFDVNVKPKNVLTWHQIRLKSRGIM